MEREKETKDHQEVVLPASTDRSILPHELLVIVIFLPTPTVGIEQDRFGRPYETTGKITMTKGKWREREGTRVDG